MATVNEQLQECFASMMDAVPNFPWLFSYKLDKLNRLAELQIELMRAEKPENNS